MGKKIQFGRTPSPTRLSAMMALFLGLIPVVGLAAEEGKATTDLSGEWKIISVESNGEIKSGAAISMDKVKFDKTKLYLGEGEFAFVMNYKVDASKRPHPVVLSIASSPFGSDTTPHDGLVALNGDEMKLIYAKPGEAAPTEFKAPEGKGYRYMKLKRSE